MSTRIFVTLPADAWGNIVLRAQESEDWGLRTLIEQAVHDARPTTVTLLDHPTTTTFATGSAAL